MLEREAVGVEEESAREGMPREQWALLEGVSVILANERGAATLYRQYAQETQDGALQRQWRRFGDEAQAHAQLAESAITALHGNPFERGEGVADVERRIDAMLVMTARGSAADLLRLSHLVMTENNSRLYWRGVGRAAPHIKDSSTAKVIRDTASVIEREKSQHVNWNSRTLEQRVTKWMVGR